MTYRTRSLSAADGVMTADTRRAPAYVAPIAALLLAVALSSPGAAQPATTPAPAAEAPAAPAAEAAPATEAAPAAEAAPATEAPAAGDAGAADPTSADAGMALFDSVGCSSCHGEKGEGVVGPKLVGSSTARNVGTLVQRILYGGGDMPPFNNLSDDEIAAVANYVRIVFNKQTVLVTAQDVATARAE